MERCVIYDPAKKNLTQREVRAVERPWEIFCFRYALIEYKADLPELHSAGLKWQSCNKSFYRIVINDTNVDWDFGSLLLHLPHCDCY